MDISILDGQTEQVVAILSDISQGACPFWDAKHYVQINGENTFTFLIPGDHRDAEFVIEGNLVAIRDKDEMFQLFEIVKMDEDHADEIVKMVTCEHQFISEMNDEFISYLVMSEQDATSMIASILAFGVTSRWVAGTIAATGTESLKVELSSKTEAINKLTDLFGLEWQFRVTLAANGSISGRFIDLISEVGEDNGKRFEYSKDIIKIERNVETYELKTALYGFGKALEVPGGIRRIDFSNVVWTTAGGDPAAKPALQTFIEDPVAKAAYGRVNGTRNRIGFYSNPDQIDPELLINETWEALQSNNSPRVEYRMTALDLEILTGFGFEAVRLGDTVKAIDHFINPSIEFTIRIREITYNYSEPEKTEITLQNETRKITFTDGSKIQQNKFTIDNRQGVWEENAYSGNTAKDHSFELMRTTATTADANGTFPVARPFNTNINTWYWGNTTSPSTKSIDVNPAPRFISEFLNGFAGLSQANRTPHDQQALVVGSSRRNPKQLVFINETIQLNGPYSYSAYIASFPGTTVNGKARLEIWANDFIGGISHRISRVGIADYDLLATSDNWYKWTRVAIPNIRNLPTSTVYLEISLTQSSANPNMQYLVDGVQLTPTEQPVSYQPESALWNSQNGLFGYFNRSTFIYAYASSAQQLAAGTSTIINYKRLSTEWDTPGLTQGSKINDPLNEYSTATGKFVPRRNGVYNISAGVRWGAGAAGNFVTHGLSVGGIHRRRFSYTNVTNDVFTNGSVSEYIERGTSVHIYGFSVNATTLSSSGKFNYLLIKRLPF